MQVLSESLLPKILVVEDEGVIAGHIATRLARVGYQVAAIVKSSEEALQKAATLSPALILMDIRIKGSLDGVETALALRKQCDIPLIFLTAHADEQTVNRAKKVGASGFLTKPVHTITLRTMIEMALHKHESDQEVKRQRAWSASILESMGEAMTVIDLSGKVLFINKLAETLIGCTREQAEGNPLSSILSLLEAREGFPAHELVLQAPLPVPYGDLPPDLTAQGFSGQCFPIEGRIAPTFDGGKTIGAVITFRDATARKAIESERRHQEKMQTVGRLAAGISHDFNNLLYIIRGNCEQALLTLPPGNPEISGMIQIQKAANDATNLTRQLLRFSRKESASRQALCLNDLIREIEPVLRRVGGKRITWKFHLNENLGLMLADKGNFRQILFNLLANARNAMPNGGEITFTTCNVATPNPDYSEQKYGDYIALVVADTGSGMTAETASHLFEPFFTTKPLGKGTGLGLSIIHAIVTEMGGTIQADSEPGRGSTFTILVPRMETKANIASHGESNPRSFELPQLGR